MSREDHPNRPLPGGGPLRQVRPGLTDAGLFTLLLIQVQERLLQKDAIADAGPIQPLLSETEGRRRMQGGSGAVPAEPATSEGPGEVRSFQRYETEISVQKRKTEGSFLNTEH